MQHIIFTENTEYKVALLIKQAAFNKKSIEKEYINKTTVSSEDIIAFNLKYKTPKTAPAGFAREYVTGLLKVLRSLKTTTLFVCDSNYFKILTGVRKVESSYGYIKKCVIKGYEDMDVILGVNYQGLFYNPNLQDYLDLSIKTLDDHINGIHIDIGTDIIHSEYYPTTVVDIVLAIRDLHSYPALTCDIEAHSLKFYKTGVATIAFAWDKHNGIAFDVDYLGDSTKRQSVIQALKTFFECYEGRLIFQNANYDMKVIINALFMEDTLDHGGMIHGITTMTRCFDDTKLMSYLATNSTAGNKLGLKHQAHEFAGDYAEDVTDITKVPMDKLLKYNLVDCLATWYVHEKQLPILIADNQIEIYENIFKPSVKTILQMELTGIPIDIDKVYEAKNKLSSICNNAIVRISNNPHVNQYTKFLRQKEFNHKNLFEWKKKREPIEHFDYIVFKPGSNVHLRELLFEVLILPVLDKTKTKLAAVGAKTLKKLVNHTNDKDIKELITDLTVLSTAKKVLSTFITAFIENSVKKSDGVYYLHGNFNLGGTVSGRLSSSQPNLQNIPSGSTYAELIKECFIAPPGWLLAGADFDSLEDKISALTTKDPNKLKVYEQGYDGHSLRAYYYFGKQMPDIIDTVNSINSIKHLYPQLRQDSKAPTFALTYMGMWKTLVNNLGWTVTKAKQVEANYHKLYSVADQWTVDRLMEASKVGYITGAFGLRVRTPLLKKTLIGRKSTPFEAEAESRTAGNALGQSYGLLNNRAGVEFQQRVLTSKYWASIKPIMQIHDSMYFLVRNKVGVVKWFNDNLPDCMAWQDLPELRHDKVKLSGGVELFYPNWNVKTKLPNNATRQQILDICKNKEK